MSNATATQTPLTGASLAAWNRLEALCQQRIAENPARQATIASVEAMLADVRNGRHSFKGQARFTKAVAASKTTTNIAEAGSRGSIKEIHTVNYDDFDAASPAAVAPASRASDPQIGFIGRLIAQKNVGQEIIDAAVDAAYTSVAAARVAITALLGCEDKPRTIARTEAPEASAVPSGRYAVESETGELRFYKVDNVTEGKWAGRTFVSVQASDDMHPVRGAAGQAILAKIAVDPKAAMLRYGMEIGSCGHCGRTLTNTESRAAGIGPQCRAKMAW